MTGLNVETKRRKNENGQHIRHQHKDAAEAAARQAEEAAMTPIEREKQSMLQEIARVERAARRCDRSQDDEEFRRLTWKAERLQGEFYARFPEEKIAAEAAQLRARAEACRQRAAGAMLYDCDGMLSHDDQCARRDSDLAEARSLESQANKLELGGE